VRPDEEPALVRAAQAGDVISLGLLLERHRPALLAHALGLLDGRTADAHDAVQETFVVALRSLQTVRDPAAVGGWLHVVLRNACLMQHRRGARERPIDDPEQVSDRSAWASLEEDLDRLALRAWIWAAIEGLSEALQLPLLLRYFSGAATYEAIAGVCGVPVGTVRSRLARARGRLSEAIATGDER
jgi:RNA polymerase sigma-70 factor (ECF subfamily)